MGKRALVVVLGDFGRSPRMQYHTVSLARQGGYQVDVVAYGGSKAIQQVLDDTRIVVHHLADQPAWVQGLPGVLRLLLKGLLQLWSLLWLLLHLPSPSVLLLQVPPALPTLPCCWLAAKWHGALFIVDWHNFGYTLMGLAMGRRHLLVRVAEGLERFWGRRADRHLCVSRAMQQELATSWYIPAVVFHDRPPATFRPTTLVEAHDLWLRLMPDLVPAVHPNDACTQALRPLLRLTEHDSVATQSVPPFAGAHLLLSAALGSEPGTGCPPCNSAGAQQPPAPGQRAFQPCAQLILCSGHHRLYTLTGKMSKVDAERLLPGLSQHSLSGPEHGPEDESQQVLQIRSRHLSICTRQAASEAAVELRRDRPAVVVSSTSWTPDEDFGILLEAVQLYDQQAAEVGASLPQLLVLVTGRGPQKAAYQARMRNLDLRNVSFRTLWLEPQDYPLLLGACDLGVCLHTSSSGLDLPMKVADMFGSGLPVCAAAYSCINELLAHGENGILFTTAQELADNLQFLLAAFPAPSAQCLAMKSSIQKVPFGTWETAWELQVKPVLDRA